MKSRIYRNSVFLILALTFVFSGTRSFALPAGEVGRGFYGPIKATLKTTDKRVTGLIPVYTGTKITDWKQVDMAGAGVPVDYGTDDNNDNGIAEPAESIRLQIARRNPTETDARDVISTLTTSDATITSIGRSSGDYRDVLAYEAKGARRDYEFTVAGADAFASIPNFNKQVHTVEFTLSTQEDGERMGTETFTMRVGGMIRYLTPRGYDDLMATISDRKELGVNNNGNSVPEAACQCCL